jgi:hypothetical protein
VLISTSEDKSSCVEGVARGRGWGREREREGGSGQRFDDSIFAECENVQDDLISGPADWHREHGTISTPAAQKWRESD